jgi:addiction module HigA family antidote
VAFAMTKKRSMPLKNPPHPGGLIRREVIDPLRLTVADAAAVLGVSRQALSLLLNERTDLSAEMALRIEMAFGPRMDHLMRIQLAFDLAQQRERGRSLRVKPYRPTRSVMDLAGILRKKGRRPVPTARLSR